MGWASEDLGKIPSPEFFPFGGGAGVLKNQDRSETHIVLLRNLKNPRHQQAPKLFSPQPVSRRARGFSEKGVPAE